MDWYQNKTINKLGTQGLYLTVYRCHPKPGNWKYWLTTSPIPKYAKVFRETSLNGINIYLTRRLCWSISNMSHRLEQLGPEEHMSVFDIGGPQLSTILALDWSF